MLQSPMRALATLARRPGHTALVIAMLGLGIGGTTAVLSLLDALVLAPLPFPEAERLVVVDQAAPELGMESVPIDYADFDLWRRDARAFEALALTKGAAFNLVAGPSVERVEALAVTHDITRVLRVEPALGRSFTPDEDAPGGPPVAILTHGLARRLFAAEAAALGRTLRLDGVPHEVVGVLPAHLRLPWSGELWVPMAADPAQVGSYRYSGLGRLEPGATLASARRDLEHAAEPLRADHPLKRSIRPLVSPFRPHFVGRAGATAWGLAVAAGLVLLVACVNVAALQLALGAERARELGIRAALGAGRGRLLAQLTAESLALAAPGAAVGVALGAYGLRATLALAADQLPFWVGSPPHPRVLLASVGAGVAATLLAGLLPALVTTRVDVMAALGAGAAGLRFRSAPRSALGALVVGEVALVQALLIAAGLVLVSQQELLRVDPGYRGGDALTFAVSPALAGYPRPEDRLALYRELRRGLESVPGVASAAASTNLPLQRSDTWFFEAEGAAESAADAQPPAALVRYSSDGYLAAMGIPIRAGRDLGPAAMRTGGSAEVVVNERFAELYWPGRDPVGRRIRSSAEAPWLTVVGVAGDVRHRGLEEPVTPGLYLPLAERPPGRLSFVLRTAVPPESAVAAVRDAVRALDPELPIFDVATLEARLEGSLAGRRLAGWVVGSFAAVGLVLACGGVFGVVTYLAGRRRPELGLRAALGATSGALLGLLLRQGLALAVLGTLLGALAAALLGGLLESLLFGVNATDPRVMIGAPALLLAVATLANLAPAVRAARVDPARALRDE